MTKPFKLALCCGRFQNLQNMHVNNIKLATELAQNTLIFVGSAQESGTERNPFPIEFRIEAVEEACRGFDSHEVAALPDMTNENDICTEWGDYVLKNAFMLTGSKPDLIIHGDDGRASDPIHWFSDEAKTGIHFLMVPRNLDSISGTRQRELLMLNAYAAWAEESPSSLHRHFHYMRSHLMTIPFYRDKYKSFLGVESK